LTQAHSDWLPFDALTIPAIKSAFESVVSTWSNRWFANGPFKLAKVRSLNDKLELKVSKAEWHAFGHGIFVDWREDIQLDLALNGLHFSVMQHKLSAVDKGLMLAFSQRILDDLVEALVDLVGHEANSNLTVSLTHPFENGDGLELQIQSISGGTIITVGITSAALARLRKKQCAHYEPKTIQDAPVVDILRPVIVRYAAELGNVNMTATELHNMAEGDVVVLDRPLAIPLDILATGSGMLLFKAMLGQQDGCLAFTACKLEGSET
jgi:flagellar motor switch/type III secretory pathway protein FliN